jgi:mono/diheme cytochrome c family protein
MKFLLGLIAGVLLLPLLAFLYVRMGYAPVATAAPELPFEHKLTHMAMNARIAREAPASAPLHPSDEDLASGARIYREDCAVCHGVRDQSRTAIAKGMFPRPPLLLYGKGVTDDPVRETFWKVKNGIRLTGMPAFVGSLTDSEIWQVSLLLANAGKLPVAVETALAAPPSLAAPQ